MPLPRPVDFLTLSRGLVAVWFGLECMAGRGNETRRDWAIWLALLYAAIVSDWLDGPLARLTGTSGHGQTLDWECDSLLTLTAAGLAVQQGAAPRFVCLPPVMRYLLVARALRIGSYRHFQQSAPWWERWAGIAQMLAFIAALAPFRGRYTAVVLRVLAPCASTAQMLHLLETARGSGDAS